MKPLLSRKGTLYDLALSPNFLQPLSRKPPPACANQAQTVHMLLPRDWTGSECTVLKCAFVKVAGGRSGVTRRQLLTSIAQYYAAPLPDPDLKVLLQVCALRGV